MAVPLFCIPKVQNEIARKYKTKQPKNAKYGLEADAVLHLQDGRYALIEIKLGSDEIEKGAEHLKEVKRLIAAHNETEEQSPLRLPDLLMVITGGAFAYTRPDGVIVCPLSALRP